MKIRTTFTIILLNLALIIILISCSSGRDYYYFNKEFTEKRYNNVSLGIIMRDGGIENLNVNNIMPEQLYGYYIYKELKKQLPVEISYFSKFDSVEWISYDYYFIDESVDYSIHSEKGTVMSFSLPKSMEQLQKEHKYDFLMYIDSISTIQIDSSNKILENDKTIKFQTTLTAKYILWDNSTLDFITMNEVDVVSKFVTSPSQSQYKKLIMKLASRIINELPMFKK